MHVNELEIKNFRNYSSSKIELGKSLNVFIGSNAQGKTNILECLYFLSTARSYRTQKYKDLIKWDKERAYAAAGLEKISGSYKLESFLTRNDGIAFKINGAKTTKVADFAGTLHTVIFSPEDLRLVKDTPMVRRKFMDFELNQIRPSYQHNMYQYNRVLMQRNNMLKKQYLSNADRMAIEVFGEQLSKYGSYICDVRNEFIKKLAMIARLVHRKITDGNEELDVSYECSTGNFEGREEIRKLLLDYYNKNIDEDHEKGMTLKGPHRDDLNIKINNIDTKAFGSQGQQRTAALSLKLSEVEIIKAETGEYPVLLLDDVMSELDSKRQKFLLDSLKEIQTIITCTSLMDIQKYNYKISNVFEVKSGTVEKVSDGKVNF